MMKTENCNGLEKRTNSITIGGNDFPQCSIEAQIKSQARERRSKDTTKNAITAYRDKRATHQHKLQKLAEPDWRRRKKRGAWNRQGSQTRHDGSFACSWGPLHLGMQGNPTRPKGSQFKTKPNQTNRKGHNLKPNQTNQTNQPTSLNICVFLNFETSACLSVRVSVCPSV